LNERYNGEEETAVHKTILTQIKNMIKSIGPVVDDETKNFLIETLTIFKQKAYSPSQKREAELMLQKLRGELPQRAE
jgi:hypothetical protein